MLHTHRNRRNKSQSAKVDLNKRFRFCSDKSNRGVLGSDTAIAVGMEEAKRFWQDLFATVLDCTPVYSHVWQPGDIIFWDNSQVMHRSTPYDATKYKRIALRLGVVDKA
ncbi:TauD/TfdA family dioxygenase [Nostoc sp. HG1]|nr:TauD/TfdA family dioxygenase [Nostoc sp. HG1]